MNAPPPGSSLFLLGAAMLAGLIYGLLHFRTLRRTVDLLAGGRRWFGPAAFTLLRIAGVVVVLTFAARLGAMPLLAGLRGLSPGADDRAACSAGDRLMDASPLISRVLFHLGPIPITQPVVTTWGIMLILAGASWLVTRRLQLRADRTQAMFEVVVSGILRQIENVIGRDARALLPLLGTLFIFLVAANLSAVLPGTQAPTARLETPAALAFVVFVSVHYFGVRARGLLGYLASFAKPKLIMLPLNLLSEVTRTFSLMVRLLGNVMSGEFVIALVVALAGLFVPIPFMALEILLGLVQAYIFTVLAAVFIGAAIGGVDRG